jgi:hypothetical protein
MATRGKLRDCHCASRYGQRYRAPLGCNNKLLETNDLSHLEAFVGLELRDSQGRFHPFEGRPNVLRKLDSVGELSFVDI